MENKKANGIAVWVLLWCRVPPGGEESADRREAISSPDYRTCSYTKKGNPPPEMLWCRVPP